MPFGYNWLRLFSIGNLRHYPRARPDFDWDTPPFREVIWDCTGYWSFNQRSRTRNSPCMVAALSCRRSGWAELTLEGLHYCGDSDNSCSAQSATPYRQSREQFGYQFRMTTTADRKKRLTNGRPITPLLPKRGHFSGSLGREIILPTSHTGLEDTLSFVGACCSEHREEDWLPRKRLSDHTRY